MLCCVRLSLSPILSRAHSFQYHFSHSNSHTLVSVPPHSSHNLHHTAKPSSHNLYHFSRATLPQPHRTRKVSACATPQPSLSTSIALHRKRVSFALQLYTTPPQPRPPRPTVPHRSSSLRFRANFLFFIYFLFVELTTVLESSL